MNTTKEATKTTAQPTAPRPAIPGQARPIPGPAGGPVRTIVPPRIALTDLSQFGSIPSLPNLSLPGAARQGRRPAWEQRDLTVAQRNCLSQIEFKGDVAGFDSEQFVPKQNARDVIIPDGFKVSTRNDRGKLAKAAIAAVMLRDMKVAFIDAVLIMASQSLSVPHRQAVSNFVAAACGVPVTVSGDSFHCIEPSNRQYDYDIQDRADRALENGLIDDSQHVGYIQQLENRAEVMNGTLCQAYDAMLAYWEK